MAIGLGTSRPGLLFRRATSAERTTSVEDSQMITSATAPREASRSRPPSVAGLKPVLAGETAGGSRALRRRTRGVRFCASGFASLMVQWILLRLLLRSGVGASPADFVAYAASAQVNFALSYRLTWCDSPRRRGTNFALTWLAFNLVALTSAVANSLTYTTTRQSTADLVAFGIATVTSLVINFSLNHFVVLRPGGR
jgi:putative flippase GtrA